MENKKKAEAIINQGMYCGDKSDKTLLWGEDNLCPSLWVGVDDGLIAVAVAVLHAGGVVSYTIHGSIPPVRMR